METGDYEDRASEQLNALADAVYFRVQLQHRVGFGVCLLPDRFECGGERLGFRASRHVSGRAPPRFAFRLVEINPFIPAY
jgi:hypothetical protein